MPPAKTWACLLKEALWFAALRGNTAGGDEKFKVPSCNVAVINITMKMEA